LVPVSSTSRVGVPVRAVDDGAVDRSFGMDGGRRRMGMLSRYISERVPAYFLFFLLSLRRPALAVRMGVVERIGWVGSQLN
jgi:hypothetical protein